MKTIKVDNATYEKIKGLLPHEPVEDLKELVGETLTFWCARYIYHGKVKAVNDTFITLENAGIVYETGNLDGDNAEDCQKLPYDALVMIQSIESILKLKW